jgi:hypothetical protein
MQRACAYSCVSQQMVTKPIRNADFGAKTEWFAYFYEVAKSLGFCFGQEKINQNKKLLLRAQTETKSFLSSALRIAQPLAKIVH